MIPIFSKKPRERSPWFQGLLDREAGCALEPCDWDHNSPGYWHEYRAGVRDYDYHKMTILANGLPDVVVTERLQGAIERINMEIRFNEESG